MNIFTIQKNVENEVVIEKSRFICTLQKVNTEAEAGEFITSIKKKYWDATHNCSAYIVNGIAQRSSDDGEPSGTAGIPMLEVLRKAGVQGVAVVVTRYFGGIKLGAGGLVRAYTNSVGKALAKAGRAQRVELGYYAFSVKLDEAGKILNLLYSDDRYSVKDVSYGEQARILLTMRKDECEEAKNYLTELLQFPVELCYAGGEIAEVPVKV